MYHPAALFSRDSASPFMWNLHELYSEYNRMRSVVFFIAFVKTMKSTNKTRNHVQPNRWLCTSQGRRNTSKILKFPKSMLLSFKISTVGKWCETYPRRFGSFQWIATLLLDMHGIIFTSLCFPTLPVRTVGNACWSEKGIRLKFSFTGVHNVICNLFGSFETLQKLTNGFNVVSWIVLRKSTYKPFKRQIQRLYRQKVVLLVQKFWMSICQGLQVRSSGFRS